MQKALTAVGAFYLPKEWRSNEKTIPLSAEYADGSKALVLGTQGYHYPCSRLDRFGRVVGKARLPITSGSDLDIRIFIHAT